MPKVLHLDMDSFFATVEQQSRPSLRGRSVGIAPVDSPGGTIVAASIEAKKFGVKTGTKVAEARELIPDIVILPPTPNKYRVVHRRFRSIMQEYRGICKPRSVDEIALWLEPSEWDRASEIGVDIKQRIRDEVGEWLSSSVGIGPNWLLAKTACSIRKPDGLLEITEGNRRDILAELDLTDLCGIAGRMAARMNLAGIRTPLDLHDMKPWELKHRLGIIGYYWHLRLNGYAIDTEDWATKTLGHSSVLPRPTASPEDLKPLLHKLCHRIARRLRQDSWLAQGLVISGSMADWGDRWVHSVKLNPTQRRDELFQTAWGLLKSRPPAAPLRKLAVTTYNLRPANPKQPSLLETDRRTHSALIGTDAVNDRWGEFTVIPAAMMGTEEVAGDAIAFGQDLRLQRETLDS
ncbi:DNA polymerase IV [Patescibacteria group bacterium]|nr:DNA polymerase IV [Patescibacteria group bacterium]